MLTLKQYLDVNQKKYLIFDFDDTLFHLHLPWHIYQEEMTNRLLQLDPTFPEERGITDFENKFTKRWGEAAAKIRYEYSQEFESKHLQGVTELHDLTDFIRQHSMDYQYFIWTSNMRETVEPILEKAGLLQIVTQLVTKGDVQLMKPNPDGFYVIFDPKTHHKQDFLMIGNSSNDRMAAEQAEIDFFMRPD